MNGFWFGSSIAIVVSSIVWIFHFRSFTTACKTAHRELNILGLVSGVESKLTLELEAVVLDSILSQTGWFFFCRKLGINLKVKFERIRWNRL